MKKTILVLAVAIFGVAAVSAFGFASVSKFSAEAVLAKPHYIGMKKAKEIAGQQVQGTIESSELEKENGKMIYSFDIKTTAGITEVNIDALTGAVIAVSVENAADEAKENAADKKASHSKKDNEKENKNENEKN